MPPLFRTNLRLPHSPALTWTTPLHSRYPKLTRLQSTDPSDSNNATARAPRGARWLPEVKARIGQCIMFGLSAEQTLQAGLLLRSINDNWRELLAGSEGFVTSRGDNNGLFRREVAWGEMHGEMTSLVGNIGSQANGMGKGHVNNVVYNRWAEAARVNWCRSFAASDFAHRKQWLELVTPVGIGLILRSIRTDYKFVRPIISCNPCTAPGGYHLDRHPLKEVFHVYPHQPIKYPDHITVLHKLGEKPRADSDHFKLEVMILSEVHRQPAARCFEDVVVYDYKQARKSPMEPFMLERLQRLFDVQEQSKRVWSARVSDILRETRELEQSSWDRLDAKEDLGGA